MGCHLGPHVAFQSGLVPGIEAIPQTDHLFQVLQGYAVADELDWSLAVVGPPASPEPTRRRRQGGLKRRRKKKKLGIARKRQKLRGRSSRQTLPEFASYSPCRTEARSITRRYSPTAPPIVIEESDALAAPPRKIIRRRYAAWRRIRFSAGVTGRREASSEHSRRDVSRASASISTFVLTGLGFSSSLSHQFGRGRMGSAGMTISRGGSHLGKASSRIVPGGSEFSRAILIRSCRRSSPV